MKSAWVLHDDPPTLGLIRTLLGAEGYEVTSVDSAFRALTSVPPGEPALVLVGVTALEDRDLELITILRRRWPRARMVVLFPSLLRERASRCLDLGAGGYLPEPFYAGELTALARAAAVETAGPVAASADAVPSNGAADGTALSKLAAGVAHTIRNPLQILELQLGSYETDGQADVDGMREQLRRIATTVESLTRYSGRRKLNTRLVDVNSLVQRVFQPARNGAGPGCRFDLSEERPEVLGAPDLLRAAMDSIKARAERATPPDLEIEVRTRIVDDGGRRMAEIVVTDAGPPLLPDALRSFFDPFPVADQVQEGTGLEMAAAAGVVRNHGGSVAAQTAADGGTSVIVRIPARGGAGGQDANAHAQETR